MSAPIKAIALLGLASMVYALSQAAEAAPSPQEIKTPADVKALAQSLIAQHGFRVTPCMATAIAIIESGDISNPANGFNTFASRYEPGIGDFSAGLMQTLTGTADWLYSIGYKAYPAPAAADLYDPATSMYFGLAMLDWLSHYRGQARGEDWIVQSYNAGPGHYSSAYLAKYKKAIAWLQNNGVC